MTEQEMIFKIIQRLNLSILEKNSNSISFEKNYGYENVEIEFDQDGKVININ